MGLAGCHAVAKSQGYLLVCIWGSLIKLQGDGVWLPLRACFVLDCGFAEFLYRALYLSFGTKCLLQIEGCLCLAGCCCPDTGLLPGMHSG